MIFANVRWNLFWNYIATDLQTKSANVAFGKSTPDWFCEQDQLFDWILFCSSQHYCLTQKYSERPLLWCFCILSEWHLHCMKKKGHTSKYVSLCQIEERVWVFNNMRVSIECKFLDELILYINKHGKTWSHEMQHSMGNLALQKAWVSQLR